MAATETMMKFLNHTYPANNIPEQRIAALESQVEGLLQWQQSFISALSFAFSPDTNRPLHASTRMKSQAEKKTKNTSVSKHVPVKEPIITVTKTTITAPTTPASEKSATITLSETVSTAATTPGSETPPLIETHKATAPKTESSRLAYRVLDVIQRYGQHMKTGEETPDSATWAGRAKFAPKVESHIVAGQPIKLILPSFPWKSINRIDKVTGALPDFGEELALSRLDNLCKGITEVYEHGAEVTIATDGLAFNDLVGITDEDTWEYSRALMSMAANKGFHNIKLVRIMDLLGLTNGKETTKESYLETIPACRRELESQFGEPDEAIREMIQTDPDTLLTYRGFIRFLETDLKYSPIVKKGTSGSQYRKIVKQVAQGMMTRAESFTKIIQAKCPNHVRLSIHPSSGAVKLSIPLIPQASGAFPKSPWHCSVAVGIDGSYVTVHSKDVRESHVPVLRDGRPYFFREKSPLYDWAEGRAELEHLYPSGLLVRAIPDTPIPQILRDTDLEKLKGLAALQSSVVVQGFANIADGKILPEAISSV
ncbi:MAG: hypothetical protein Q9225_002562 [Loekoesia sp. 1 TL-2023]